MKRVARRTVIRALLAADPLVFGFPPMHGLKKPTDTGKRGALETVALEVLGDRQAARAVGRAYLSEYPSERCKGMLAGLQGVAARAGSNRGPELFAALQRANRADFAVGNIVEVDGWILGRTEARICALAATI